MINKNNPVSSNNVGFKGYYHFSNSDAMKIRETLYEAGWVRSDQGGDGLFFHVDDKYDSLIVDATIKQGIKPLATAESGEYGSLLAFKEAITGKVNWLDRCFSKMLDD